MMRNVATKYDVRFVADVDGDVSAVKFTASDPEDVKDIVSALAAYYSGDPCRCFINGQEAVLENDWGLANASDNRPSLNGASPEDVRIALNVPPYPDASEKQD